MREPIGQMSEHETTTAERETFRKGIEYAILGLGGCQTEDDFYRRVYQLDTAAGTMTVNVPHNQNASWLGSIFCYFQHSIIAEELLGRISQAGWKNFHYNADWTAEDAIHDWVQRIAPVTTTIPV